MDRQKDENPIPLWHSCFAETNERTGALNLFYAIDSEEFPVFSDDIDKACKALATNLVRYSRLT